MRAGDGPATLVRSSNSDQHVNTWHNHLARVSDSATGEGSHAASGQRGQLSTAPVGVGHWGWPAPPPVCRGSRPKKDVGRQMPRGRFDCCGREIQLLPLSHAAVSHGVGGGASGAGHTLAT